jgi:hypothetical protein
VEARGFCVSKKGLRTEIVSDLGVGLRYVFRVDAWPFFKIIMSHLSGSWDSSVV